MSITILRPGKPIVLRLLLEDGVTNKHIRAFVSKDDGTPLTGSPFTLPHISNGLYVFKDINNLVFPGDNTDEVHALYITYNDPGFSTESPKHFRSLDIYGSSLNSCGTDGSSPSDDGKSGLTSITGVICQNQILGHINSQKLTGFVEQLPKITGFIAKDHKLTGLTQRTAIIGVVTECKE